MAGELINNTFRELINSLSEQPPDSSKPYDERYSPLKLEKTKIDNLSDEEKNKKALEVIRGQELSRVYKRIKALELVDSSKKLDLVEDITDELFNLISDLNVDLLLSEEDSSEYNNVLKSLAVAFYIYEQLLYPISGESQNPNQEVVEAEQSNEQLSKKEFIKFLGRRIESTDRILDFHIGHAVNINKKDFHEMVFSFVISQMASPSVGLDATTISSLERFRRISSSFAKRNPDRSISEIDSLKDDLLAIKDISDNPDLADLVEDLSNIFKKYFQYMGSATGFMSDEDLLESLDDLPVFLHESSEITELQLAAEEITPASLKKYSKEELENLKIKLERLFVDALPYISSIAWVSYNEIPKKVIDILKRYYSASNAIEMILDPGFSGISMKDAANRVIELNRDIYKYQALKDPNSSIKDDVDLLFKRFGYLAGTSVFSDAVGVLGHDYFNQTTFNLFRDNEIRNINEINEDGIPVEITNNEKAMNLLLNFFRAAFDKRGAQQAYDSLIIELRRLGKSNSDVEKWGMKIYRELAKEEVDRNYWKVRVQLHFVKKEMEKEKSATVPRDRLYSELTRVIFDREELLLASTAHPEYGKDIVKMLDSIEDHAAMNPGDVVLRRTIERSTINPKGEAIVVPEQILHRIKCPGLRGSSDEKAAVFRAFITNLKNNGEEIVYICDDQGFDENGFDETQPNVRGQKIASYTDLASLRSGINSLETELRVKFKTAPDEAKQMAFLEFIVFDRLNTVLGELQTNTKTRAHNGDIEDVDRIAVFNILLGAVHRMFRYDDPGRDAASNCLSRFDKLPGADVSLLYSDEELKKKGHEDKNTYKTASGNPVSKDLLPFFGKSRKDHNWYAGAQIAANEYLERFFDWSKVPKIRLRGFMEPLGFDTEMLYKLADGKKTSSGKDEAIFDPTRGIINYDGSIVEQINGLQDIASLPSKLGTSNLNKSPVTTWNFYPLAEENAYLKIEEMLNDKIADNLVNSEVILSKIHDLWKLWGKVKMFPSTVIADSFVPTSYEFIMRAVHTCEDIQDNDRVEPLFFSILGSLINNMVERGGLVDYQEEMVTLINLLCKHPIYEYHPPVGNIPEKTVRINGVSPEPSNSWYKHTERHVEKDRYAVTYLMHHLLTRAYRLPNDIIQSAMMERPKLFEGFSRLSIFEDVSTWLKDKVAGPWGLRDINIIDLEKHLKGDAPAVFDRSGSLIQPKEKDK